MSYEALLLVTAGASSLAIIMGAIMAGRAPAPSESGVHCGVRSGNSEIPACDSEPVRVNQGIALSNPAF